MKKQLKWEIIKFIFEKEKVFQLKNTTATEFKEYIYSSKGDYLIGGEEVSKFIDKAIDLLIEK